jgi:hypothetical protein
MDSFNPLADVMRASIGSLARNMSRTDEEKKAEGAAVVMIITQAADKVVSARRALREEHQEERKARIAGGLKPGTPEWDELLAGQATAMAAFDRLMAKLG